MDWQSRTRALLNQFGSWKPCICIQGGGAKGAWEAGVLAALLANKRTSPPVAIWGTSAGALNGVWASTLPEGSAEDALLQFWLKLSRRITLLSIIIGLVLLSLIVALGVVVYRSHLLPILAIGAALLVITVIDEIIQVRCGLSERLPGVLSIALGSKLLPLTNGTARWYCYFCTADVSAERPPAAWDAQDLNIFCMSPGDVDVASLIGNDSSRYDARLAVMSSAALPGAFRPLRLGGKLLLDGGLESNLPIGFMKSSGALGGACAICIVPRPLHVLDRNNHVDYRVLRFLRDLQRSQAFHRRRANRTGVSVSPSHAHSPIIVVSPRKELQSGLIFGFFHPTRLREEFQLGRKQAKELVESMARFESGDDDALDGFLLERHNLEQIGDSPPEAWLLGIVGERQMASLGAVEVSPRSPQVRDLQGLRPVSSTA